MFLKRIEIFGFKSFAQRCVLEFEYDKNGNITAVVGPNGSGKSNVADAIRWVTGEQSTKNLRGKKSEDVIFCGSASKQRGSYAEVSIVLSSDKPFKFELNNKEYSLTEVEVARKLYRSGESEYLINQKKVRLTDIQQLLASLGFGQSSYTVIGQGMVDRLLFFTAAERKVLFDEAAGVKQYEIKREQAIRKLESTDSNLIRLKDILTEISPRVINLRRLVKRAEGRKELEQEYSETQNKYFGSLYSEYLDLSSRHNQEKKLLNNKITQLEKEIFEFDEKRRKVTENPYYAERKEAEKVITTISTSRDKLMQEVAYLKGQVESINRNEEFSNTRRGELTSEKEALVNKINLLTEKISHNINSGQKIKEQQLLKSELDKINAQITLINNSLKNPGIDDPDRINTLKMTLQDLIDKKRLSEEATRTLKENELKLSELNEKKKVALELNSKLNQELEDILQNTKKAQSNINLSERELENLEKTMKQQTSLVTPESLSQIDKNIADLEMTKQELLDLTEKNLKAGLKSFFEKLNKLFIQFKDISKAVNSFERENLEKEIQSKRLLLNEKIKIMMDLNIASSKIEAQIGVTSDNIRETEEKILLIKKQMEELKIKGKASFDNEITRLEVEIKSHEGTVNERVNTLLREKDTLQSKLNDIRDKNFQLELEINRNNSILENQKHELTGAEKRLVEIENLFQNLSTNVKKTEQVVLVKNLSEKEKELDKLEEDLAKHRGGMTQIISAEREFEQRGIQLERERRDLIEKKSLIANQLSALEIEITKVTIRLEDLSEEMRMTGFFFNKEVDYPYLDQLEKDVLKVKLENLRRKLDTSVGIDPETEAEFTELEQREIEMSTQLDDLSKAKNDLEKVVRELDERIKKQFFEVFGSISKEFSRYFSILFNGGNAELKLGEDEEGTFGIEIKANPPGKRIQSLNSLSGGERTLTSLALLFAILSVNPSPFCVLDEVDAALDESNTLRFIKILVDLAKKTQFIIISHNRDTMKAANSLYGVTMNDEHVSKLLSVKLTEALVSTTK